MAVLLATVGLLLYASVHAPVHAASQNSSPEARHEGRQIYASQCAICHGEQREGILPSFPPLLGLQRRSTIPQETAVIQKGKGRMPGFPNLKGEELTSLLHYLESPDTRPKEMGLASSVAVAHVLTAADMGSEIFQQNCAFCHGRDATGGETGPDLTRSKLVHADKGGNQITGVIRNGRIEKKMPAFNFSDVELHNIVAFIHGAETSAEAKGGDRKGVDVSDLQTGDVAAGKRYFNGPGTCATCHSPTGDLAGVASRHEGLELEERMLYPRDATARASVTTPSGERVDGTLAYQDEFVLGVRDRSGTYRSWSVKDVKYTINAPAKAHAALLTQYTDADVHNLMAYIQTLR